jgi:hypothetical protein
MDLEKTIAELRVKLQHIEGSAEREQIEEAILDLERVARSRGRGPGRPPNWMADITPKRRGRPPGSKDKIPIPDLPPAGAALPIPRPKLDDAVSGRMRCQMPTPGQFGEECDGRFQYPC